LILKDGIKNNVIMKKSNENKSNERSSHNVETPTPPQVMDASVSPVKKKENKNKPKKETRTAEQKRRPEEEKLAPNEEL
jgi:hypothetical protein